MPGKRGGDHTETPGQTPFRQVTATLLHYMRIFIEWGRHYNGLINPPLHPGIPGD